MTDGTNGNGTAAPPASRLLSRRDLLKATAGAGAVAAGIGAGLTGSASAGIPTPRLGVDGNLVKTQTTDETVKLRGLNIADPKRIDVTAPARGKTALQVVDMLTDPGKGWYPRALRVPTQAVDIGNNTPGSIDGAPEPPAFTREDVRDYVETYLDPVVDRCEERGVYCIVDFHRHWKPLKWAEGSQPGDPVNEALQTEVMTYWDEVAPRYADRDHVLYEVYNEPTEPGMWGDPTTSDHWANVWAKWKSMAQPWVDRIREAGDNVVLIGSPSWTQSPEGALVNPFDGENLAYTYHTYPGHNVSRTGDWAGPAGNGEGTAGVYEEHPLFVTEFGWDDLPITEYDYETSRYLDGTTSEFGEPFMEFLESSPGIHWTAWCADPIWLPAMFDLGDWVGEGGFTDSIGDPYSEDVPELCPELPCEWTITTDDRMGAFIKQALADRRDDGVPSGEGPTVTEATETTTDSTGDEGPPAIDGNANRPTDPDGDGKYEDLTGNGEADPADVVRLFEHKNDPVVADYPEYYDFSGNGEIEVADVVELFGEL